MSMQLLVRFMQRTLTYAQHVLWHTKFAAGVTNRDKCFDSNDVHHAY